jgi:LGFP repeat
MPGGHSSLSANGDQDGIIWTIFPDKGVENGLDYGQYLPVTGKLYAFDAMHLGATPWQDSVPEWFAKFNPPTIADGKVFRPCFAKYEDIRTYDAEEKKVIDTGVAPHWRPDTDGKVVVYGLRQWKPPERPGLWELIIGLIDDSFGKIIGRGGVKPGPPPPFSAIEAKWRSYGGILAAPAGPERGLGDDRGGRRRDFVGAITTPEHRFSVRDLPPGGSCDDPPTESVAVASSIFWSPETGAHIVSGEIRDQYLAGGGPTGELGYPLSDEADSADGLGRISYFENGYIIWTRDHGPQVRLV